MPTTRTVAAANEALEAGFQAELKDDLQQALAHYADASIAAGADPGIVARALIRQAGVYRRMSEWELSVNYARRAHELAGDAGLDELRVDALVSEGNALMCAGRFDEALAVYQRLMRSTADDRQRGVAMQNIGSIQAQRGDHERARESFETSRFLFQRAGYMRGEAVASNNLGRLALDCGELSAAEALLQRALIGARAVEDAELTALALLNLAQLRVAQGSLNSGAMMCAGAHAHFLKSENRWRQVECLCVLAEVAERESKLGEARDYLLKGAELARAIDAPRELAQIEERLARLA